MKRISVAVGSLVCAFALAGCGGSSTSDTGTGGTSSGGASSGGTSSGGTSSGGTSSGGTSSGGTGGANTGGSGGALTCGPEAKACAQPSDCVLNSPSCCLCGLPELSDFEAINSSFVQQCSCQGPACGCATQENPNLAATCEAGSCVGFDVRQEEYSACAGDNDCTLRNGLGCCESCQGSEFNVVAVNVNQTALVEAVCGDELQGCPDCVVQYPPNKKASCISNHCQVVDK
jgi:hypothetical protein